MHFSYLVVLHPFVRFLLRISRTYTTQTYLVVCARFTPPPPGARQPSQVEPIVAPCNCAGRPWRARVQSLVMSDKFSNFVVSVLVINAVVLALGEYRRDFRSRSVACGLDIM